MVLNIPHPLAALCFLEHPIEFGAPDGQPVDILFLLVSPTIAGHLSLLSKLSFAIHQSVFLGSILQRASAEAILASAALIDRIAPHSSAPGREEPNQ